MKYKLLNTTFSADTPIYDVVNEERNEKGEITVEASETKTDKFFVNANLSIEVLLESEHFENPIVNKSLTIESNKNQSGHEIEKARYSAIEEFITSINK